MKPFDVHFKSPPKPAGIPGRGTTLGEMPLRITNPWRQLNRMNRRHVRKAERWQASGRWPTPATDKRAVGRAYDMLVAIACSERDEPHHWG